LIEYLDETDAELFGCQSRIAEGAQAFLKTAFTNLQVLTSRLPLLSHTLIANRKSKIEIYRLQMQSLVRQKLSAQHSRLKEKESFFRLSSPKYILDKGYSITLKKGKAIKSTKELQDGDTIETLLAEGKVTSIVTHFNSK